MPIVVQAKMRRMSQAEFGAVAHEVMRRVFDIHNEMGRFFDEPIYQTAVASAWGHAQIEVPIQVIYGDFRKDYFMDLLVDDGAVFEFKAVEKLTGRHRAQLLNYLLLAELSHGKLINVRPDLVEHEFVNTTLTCAERTAFAVDDADWIECSGGALRLKEQTVAILRDWGTALEIPLYTEALTHFLGGFAVVVQEVKIFWMGRPVGRQKVRLAAPDTSFRITQIDDPDQICRFEEHLRRFLMHTELTRVQWINITLHQVTFRTIQKQTN
jgi:GxxExxY protein